MDSEKGQKTIDAVAEDVRILAANHSKNASLHRLKQSTRVPNANLAKANIAQQRNTLKVKLKLETLRVELELWIYPFGGSSAKKVSTAGFFSMALLLTSA